MSTIDHDAVTRRDRAARNLRVATFAVVSFIALSALFGAGWAVAETQRINNVAEQARTAADRIADCTTPKGECYERSKASGAAAVKAIIDALDQAEAQRTTSTRQILANQERFRQAIRELCAANHMTCPSLH